MTSPLMPSAQVNLLRKSASRQSFQELHQAISDKLRVFDITRPTRGQLVSADLNALALGQRPFAGIRDHQLCINKYRWYIIIA